MKSPRISKAIAVAMVAAFPAALWAQVAPRLQMPRLRLS